MVSGETREVCKCGHMRHQHPERPQPFGCLEEKCSCLRYEPSIPAETREPKIPEGLEKDHAIAKREPNEPWNGEFMAELIERITRSETRVEVLEKAAQRYMDWHDLETADFQAKHPGWYFDRVDDALRRALEGKG